MRFAEHGTEPYPFRFSGSKSRGVFNMAFKTKLLAIGFAIVLAMSVAACDVEEDPAVPEGSVGSVERVS
jgi:hypothetical protein